MYRLKEPDLPDNNNQVGSTNITYAPVKAISQTFLEDTQDMKKDSATPESHLPADSAKLTVSESLPPDDLHFPIQGEKPGKSLSKPTSKNKYIKFRDLQKLAAIVTILAGITGAANHSFQLWRDYHAFKNSSASPPVHDIKLGYQVK
ncbi:hypothetical protein [Microcoleus sp. B4-D4]|uniref:hypothetical protein n=1 Tax=Microcoleus sp. B4-D4 TaxID=2818667 RepID=UPI002FD6728C